MFHISSCRSRLGGRVYPIEHRSPGTPEGEPGEFLDLGASYWHSCAGYNEADPRNRRLPQRSVAGLAKLHNPRVAIVAGGSKWEDPLHALWFHEGPVQSNDVLRANLFLSRVLLQASSLLRDPDIVRKQLLLHPHQPANKSSFPAYLSTNNRANSNSSEVLDAAFKEWILQSAKPRGRKRRRLAAFLTTQSQSAVIAQTDDPFLFKASLTTLDELFELAEFEVHRIHYKQL